jgi:hypothetical protein
LQIWPADELSGSKKLTITLTAPTVKRRPPEEVITLPAPTGMLDGIKAKIHEELQPSIGCWGASRVHLFPVYSNNKTEYRCRVWDEASMVDLARCPARSGDTPEARHYILGIRINRRRGGGSGAVRSVRSRECP